MGGLRLPATAVAVCTALAVPVARAQDARFDTADSLYAAYELCVGGRPFYRTFFARGWPTDRPHRRAALELAAGSAGRTIRATLASGAGLPLTVSVYQHHRRDLLLKAGKAGTRLEDLTRRDLGWFAARSGAERPPRGFVPTFLPVRRARAALSQPWKDDDPSTWAWAPPREESYTLEAVGFCLLAEAAYAREELTARRDDEERGGKASWVGHSPTGGLFGFLALQSASAKLLELKRSLVLDLERRAIVSRSSLRGLKPRDHCFPKAWTAKRSGDSARYSLPEGEDRFASRLGHQAAVLWAAARLAELSDPSGPEELRGLFEDQKVRGELLRIFLPSTHSDAVEVAVFVFRTISKLHVDVKGSAKVSSTADRYQRGPTLTPTDLGLFLLALEAFVRDVRLAPARRGKPGPEVAALKVEQGKAKTLLAELCKTFFAWRQNQSGLFYDSYSVRTATRQQRTRSLASQAFAIRGLLAAHRGLKAAADSSYLTVAKEVFALLDKERWDPARRVYTEEKGSTVPLFGAAAVLGALRELALTTGDGRYLTRFRQYLEGLERAGLFRAANDKAPPGYVSELKLQ
ncbi:MAG: hypothetical protein D6731_18155 [Planctomycetota bacterium]|nr:MAG: hypothetical protein D6731_18155 [Planctomycetota bacterium]